MKVISNRVNLFKLLLSDIFLLTGIFHYKKLFFCHYGHVAHTTAGKTNPDTSSKLLNMAKSLPTSLL